MQNVINFAVEDLLSEIVLRKIIERDNRFIVGNCYSRGGYGYLKNKINGFNNAAKGVPFIVLCDLVENCPPDQIKNWLRIPKHPNLLFRIAVKEIESWLLADNIGFSSFLGINIYLIPENTDIIDKPKQYLINLVKKSPKRKLREAILPINASARVGPDYNGQLSIFINSIWNITRAMKNSESLNRTINTLNKFELSETENSR